MPALTQRPEIHIMAYIGDQLGVESDCPAQGH
jgi:hypothetical protein